MNTRAMERPLAVRKSVVGRYLRTIISSDYSAKLLEKAFKVVAENMSFLGGEVGEVSQLL